MKDITISSRQAVQSLNDTNLILVLREVEGIPGLVKRYLPREEAIALISENKVEMTGDEAKKKNFGMSFKDSETVYFVETKPND